jgi:hypothetical protein
MSRDESIVLVEGYDDRSFWQGLLLRRGCEEARNAPLAQHRQQAGFTYRTPSDTLVHVIPCKGAPHSGIRKGDELQTFAKIKLAERANKPLRRLVLSPDADQHATLDRARSSVRSIVISACPDAQETAEGDFLVDQGGLMVSAMFLHADAAGDDPAGAAGGEGGPRPEGVPAQRALEQLVCRALCKVHPARGQSVARWLAGRPDPDGKDHKAHAWSFYAGWSTAHGPGDFYASIWRDEPVAAALEDLLRAQGAWRIVDALLGLPGSAAPDPRGKASS